MPYTIKYWVWENWGARQQEASVPYESRLEALDNWQECANWLPAGRGGGAELWEGDAIVLSARRAPNGDHIAGRWFRREWTGKTFRDVVYLLCDERVEQAVACLVGLGANFCLAREKIVELCLDHPEWPLKEVIWAFFRYKGGNAYTPMPEPFVRGRDKIDYMQNTA